MHFMGADNNRIINGILFEDEDDYRQAEKEWNTICNLEKKLPLSEPKAALQLYNQAVTKKTFKTPVGYSFLYELQTTVISSGLVASDMLNPIPITSRKMLAVKASGKSGLNIKKDIDYSLLYAKEKKRRKVLTFAIAALVAVIIGMFVITLSSKYSFITYFTNYEDNIRNEVIDEYENWKNELDEREDELKAREVPPADNADSSSGNAE